MASKKDVQDFLASKEALEVNIHSFHAGKRELYRVIATELRKLLCDGKSTLLKRMFINLNLHPILGSINKYPEDKREGLLFHMPSVVYSNKENGAKIVALFNKKGKVITLNKWLNQSLFSNEITIETFIRSISDKESVHSDKVYNQTLKFLKNIKLSNEEIHKTHMVAIGEYILWMINGVILNYPETFTNK